MKAYLSQVYSYPHKPRPAKEIWQSSCPAQQRSALAPISWVLVIGFCGCSACKHVVPDEMLLWSAFPIPVGRDRLPVQRADARGDCDPKSGMDVAARLGRYSIGECRGVTLSGTERLRAGFAPSRAR